MAQNFRNQLTHSAIGTGATDILTQVSTFDAVVGIRLVNVVGSAINVDVYIQNSSNNTYLIKSAPIPAGSSLELIDGGSKIILKSGDKIVAVSDTASSLNTAVSYISTISS
jgi:hypothetical protein